ncbi:MAG: glycosyltransferase family A protein [Chloroflexota bacterium]
MKTPSSGHPSTTVVIPLFKSRRFMPTIIANINALPAHGVEVLISDRHCHDDTIDQLAQRYADDPRIRCLKHQDKLDWVAHINSLLEEAQGEYWRFLAHDDLSPAGSLEALIHALDSNTDAILAYGPIKAIDMNDNPLPERDKPDPHPAAAEASWTLGIALEMFWTGYFNGAFKGLVRRNIVMQSELLIRSTQDQIYPERCWLFALCLLGRFHFVPQATYVKRFYEGSVHSRWKITGRNYLSCAHVMSSYLCDLLKSSEACSYGTADLKLNAQRYAQWRDNPAKMGKRPSYQPFPDPGKILRTLPLP